MSGKVLNLPKSDLVNEHSREAFLKELVGEESSASWERGVAQDENWALMKEAKKLASSSLADDRTQAEEIQKKLQGRGVVSRREKLRQLKEAREQVARILYIGNDQELYDKQVAALENCELEQIGNPKQALEILQEKSFRILIIEYDLPMGNALQFLNTYRKVPYFKPSLSAILVPRGTDASHKKLAAKLGVKLWLERPFDSHVLSSCVQRLIEKHNE